MNKILYTTIFGGYDNLVKPDLSEDWKFKCFSEKTNVPLYIDNTRNAKRFKVLPHRYLSDFKYSIFIDGNMYVVGDMNELIETYLSDCNIALFDHGKNVLDSRNCVYDEYNAIITLGNKNKNFKDNPDIMYKQVKRYEDDGYPPKNGLGTTMVLVRRHNEKDCIKLMENWWTEIKYNSKRDQLSFNYVAWKHKVKFNYIEGDSRDNQYFKRSTKPHLAKR
tara:strand:- start:404 stop:1063 length:660 start_codon:yes stop_codon:yes gene_type:complete